MNLVKDAGKVVRAVEKIVFFEDEKCSVHCKFFKKIKTEEPYFIVHKECILFSLPLERIVTDDDFYYKRCQDCIDSIEDSQWYGDVPVTWQIPKKTVS